MRRSAAAAPEALPRHFIQEGPMRPRSRQWILGPLLGLALAGISATAQPDMPRRKSGLWETTMQLPGGRGGTMSTQECIDEKTDADTQRRAIQRAQDAEGRCEQRNARRSADGYAVEYSCTGPRGKIEGRLTMKGDFSAKYSMDNEARFDPPRGGMRESRMTMEGVWKGPCPADMKPGETRMSGLPMRAQRGERGASRPARQMSPEQAAQLQQMLDRMKQQGSGGTSGK
jgi:hypothetical protein